MNALQSWYPGDPVVLWGVNVLVQLTLVAAVALLVARCIARNPAVRHGVLCCALLLMLLAPAAVTIMPSSGLNWLSVSLFTGQTAAASAETASRSADAGTTEEAPGSRPPGSTPDPDPLWRPAAELEPHNLVPNAAMPERAESVDADVERATAVVHPPEGTARQDSQEAQSAAVSLAPLVRITAATVLLLWFLGAVVLLGRMLVGWSSLISAVRAARPIASESLSAAAAAARRVLRTTSTPALVSSPRVAGPVAAGLWHPRVILPEGMLDQVSPRELRDVVIHEMAHILRRDQVIVLLQNLAAAVFWIHPAVRLVNRQLARAREEVCDNYVLTSTDAPSYSRTLLRLAQSLQGATPLPWTVGLLTSRWTLESRVAGLLDERRIVMTRLTARGAALVVVLSLFTAALALSATIKAAPADILEQTAVSPADSELAATAIQDQAEPETETRTTTDALGDPLPTAAMLRLGTLRFRHPSAVNDMALSPDAQSVATFDGTGLIVWNAVTGQQRWQTDQLADGFRLGGSGYGIRAVAFTADSRRLYSAGGRNEVIVWDTASGRRESQPLTFPEEPARGADSPFTSVDLAPGGETLALGSAAGVVVCDPHGTVKYEIANNPAAPLEIADDRLKFTGHFSMARFAPEGKLLAVVTSDTPEALRLCDAETGQELRRIALSAWLVRMAFSPDGKTIATTQRDKAVRLYEVDSGTRVWSHTVELNNPYENYTSAVAFSPDGKIIAAGATDNRIYLLDAETGDETGRFPSAGWYPWGLEFTADSGTLFSSGWDGSVRRWDVSARKQLALPAGVHATGIVAAAPDGRMLAYASDAGAVHLVTAADAAQQRTLGLPGARYSQVIFSPDSQRLAGGGALGDQVHVAVWNVEDGALLHRWDWPKGRDPHSTVESLDFTPDGTRLAAAVFRQSTAYIWNLTTNQRIAALPHVEVYGLSFSPDGQTLATAGWDSVIRFWEPDTGRLRDDHKVVDANADPRMYRVRYAPQGELIAAAHLDGKVRVWHAAGMQLRTEFEVDGRFIYGALSFSPDGLWLATGSMGGRVSVWDPLSGQEVWNRGAHDGYVYTVGFGRDSRRLVSGGRDGVCYVWDLRPAEQLPDKDPDGLWHDLGGKSSAAAYQAMWALSETPDRTVAMLRDNLRMVKREIDPNRVRRWIAELDAPEFETRKSAQAELASLGDAVLESLREAAAEATSPEQVARLKKLLADIEGDERSIAVRRGVSVLGWLGIPPAERLLKELATEDPDGVSGRAAAALRRE